MALRLNTKQLIADAFLELLSERDFSSITVKDIVERCGGSRQTFYRYYRDKFDLANWIILQSLENLYSQYRAGLSWIDMIERAQQSFKDRGNFYRKVYRLEELLDAVFNSFSEFMAKEMAKRQGASTVDEHTQSLIDFYCLGSRGYTQRWISGGMRKSAHENAVVLTDALPLELQMLIN